MDLKELLKKKLGKTKPMDEKEKEAKSGVLDELLAAADEAMGEGLAGLKKVTVAAPSKEGLEMGLEKAKEALEEGSESEEDEEKEEYKEEGSSMSPEAKKAAFKQKMQKLMAGK